MIAHLLAGLLISLPSLVWGQHTLPPCPANGPKHNCFGQSAMFNGIYIGEFVGGKMHGQGTYIYTNGNRYAGEFREDTRNGLGIEYSASGTINASGIWKHYKLDHSISLDTNRFPFSPITPTQVTSVQAVAADSAKTERDRLTAQVDTERRKRQELEERLAAAEAKERERQQAQAPQPQRPQVVLRNERRLALIIGNSSY